jgi:all-trans-nonaprenyl-diphosphate synthase
MTGTLSSGHSETTKALELPALLEPVTAEMQLVEQWLQSNLVDDSAFVATLLTQVFQSGGKRIRPGLVLLTSRASAPGFGELSPRHIILAVLTELIHTASLVHDDVIDRAALRRGQETVNRKWSDKLAVLVGDLLFAQASICLARLMNPAIVGIYGQVLGDLCAGEIKQMNQQFACQVDWDGYLRKSVCKTASLFSAGCHSGPILNGCGDEVVAAMKSYGTNLGICFQIVDDLLDVTATSEELGKPAGGDLAQGIITAPALFILERKDEVASSFERLIKERAVCQPEGIAEALQIMKSQGGVEQTVKLARDYAKKSKDELRCLKPSQFRDSLESIVDYLLLRTR